MHDVEVIEDPAAAAVALDPIRARLLAELVEPGSAATLASTGRHHPPEGQLPPARRSRRTASSSWPRSASAAASPSGCCSATAASYVVSPAALAEGAVDPDQAADHLSARYLVALAGRVVREVGDLAAPRRARPGKRLPTMAHRHRDPLPLGRGPRRVRRRAHRGGARARRPLPPRRRPAAPARRRRPPQTRAEDGSTT